MKIERSDLIDQVIVRLRHMEPDALWVMIRVASGLVEGRKQYGDLDIEQDERDWDEELMQEIRDALVYVGIKMEKSRRAKMEQRNRSIIAQLVECNQINRCLDEGLSEAVREAAEFAWQEAQAADMETTYEEILREVISMASFWGHVSEQEGNTEHVSTGASA